MAVKTQGTRLYVIDPDDESLITVDCVLNIDGIDTTNEQIETTCLESLARTYLSGLATPGQASFGINFDPAQSSHTRLHQLKVAGTSLLWAIGFADGTAPPTVDSGGTFDFPATRSFIRFEGFMTNFPFSFAQNAVITGNVSIQISGEPEIHAKT